MRIVVAPSGSRGDFQPMLTLALGLRAAGHDAVLLTGPNFASEARAFGVPLLPHGLDVEAYIKAHGFEASPLRGSFELLKIGRREVAGLIDEGLPHVRGADLLIGAGAQVAGPTLAEAAKVPYAYVAYTPQALRSAHHPPFVIPLAGMPRPINQVLWATVVASIRAVFEGPLNQKRAMLGLAPVTDWYGHFFPIDRLVLAADPELAPPPPDVTLRFPPTGSLHLPDTRPLDPALERFLSMGPQPVYIGFGSMPDQAPEATTRMLVEAARAVGARLVLSKGWSGLGAGIKGSDVFVAGPTSHGLLFPRVSAVVHHGGAGTTSAALRAGRPQIVVAHAFDQLEFGMCVERAKVGPAPLTRSKLTAERLRRALDLALRDRTFAKRAEELGQRVRERDSLKATIEALENLS